MWLEILTTMPSPKGEGIFKIFCFSIDKGIFLWYNIFVRNREKLRSSMYITKISPRAPKTRSGGRFLCRLTDHFFPSSHLQSSSTNKPAMTEIIKLRSISKYITPFHRNCFRDDRQVYYTILSRTCQILSIK